MTLTIGYITQEIDITGVKEIIVESLVTSMHAELYRILYISDGFGGWITVGEEIITEEGERHDIYNVEEYTGIRTVKIGFGCVVTTVWDPDPTSYVADIYDVYTTDKIISTGSLSISLSPARRGIGISNIGGDVPWGP